MAITSYPRVTIQGSGAAQNPQNGLGLMILNPSTGLYEAATAATFGGGGGAGGATSANQTTQIDLAQDTVNRLTEPVMGASVAELLFNNDTEQSIAQLIKLISDYTSSINTASYAFGQPFSNYLNDISVNTNDMKNTLTNIYNLLNNGQAKVVVVSTTGDSVGVTSGRLNVDTGA